MKRIITLAAAAALTAGAGYGVAAAYGSPNSTPADWAPVAIPAELPALGQLLHGETVYADDGGAIRTVGWQHGQVTTVSASAVTVRSTDGTEWTWTIDGDTTIYQNDEPGSAADVASGDTVRVTGTRDGERRTASTVSDPPPDFTKIRERLGNLPELPPLRPR